MVTDHLGNVRGVVTRGSDQKYFSNYYPFGMPMPNRNTINNNYRYVYQGQEKDPETGKEAFELRLWDARIGRWLTTDPYRQFASPYLGMGNNPINMIDKDGGKADGIFTLNEESGKVTKISDVGDDVGQHLVVTVNNKGEVLNTKEFHTNPGSLTVNQALLNDSFYAHFLSETSNVKAGVNLLKSHKTASTSTFMRMFYNDAADKIQTTGGVVQLVGYGLTLTGEGAVVGAPMMQVGGGMSALGTAMKIPQYVSDGNYKNIVLVVTSEAIGHGIGKFFAKLHNAGVISKLSEQILGGGASIKSGFVIDQFKN